jgi:succinyl-diaminopimelate desuccinylase
MDSKALKKVYTKIEGYRDEMISLQGQLTAIPALSPVNEGDGEAKKAAFFKGWLEKEKIFDTIEQYNSPDSQVPSGVRPNLVALMKGKSSERRIWVMGHLDIVPPGDLNKWASDPYKVKVEGGKIYGRGVEDNQHGIVTPLFAAKALRQLSIVPTHDIGLILVADEETGSEHGIQFLLKKHGNLFQKNDFIIVPDAGAPDGTMIEVAEKSIFWLKIETKGKQCHASTPKQGINAHRAAAHLITKIDKLYKLFPQKNKVFDPPISTFEPTKKEANVPNINTIPGDDVIYIDMRILPEIKIDDVFAAIKGMIKEVEEKFGVKITTSAAQREDAAPATPPDAPVVLALSAAIKAVYRVKAKPKGIGGGTVAAFFRRHGFGAVVWSKIDEVAHQPNEYTIIENMVGDAKVFANLFLQE